MNNGMKRITLMALFKAKIDSWLESIADEELRNLAKSDVILSGGAIASGLMGDKINDYDLYFRTKDTAFKIAQYYCKQFTDASALKPNPDGRSREPKAMLEEIENCKGVLEERVVIRVQSAGVATNAEKQDDYKFFENHSSETVEQYFNSIHSAETPIETVEELHVALSDKSKKFAPVFITDNAISLTGKVQLVIRFFGEPEQLHENYDYVHAMCYYDYSKKVLNIPAEALESMMSKSLVYGGSLYPIASLLRLRKFISRGWRINAGQMLKIIFQVSKLNLEDPRVLREQLLGVDMAYMAQLIAMLNTREPGQKIDAVYFAKLIDMVFEA